MLRYPYAGQKLVSARTLCINISQETHAKGRNGPRLSLPSGGMLLETLPSNAYTTRVGIAALTKLACGALLNDS